MWNPYGWQPTPAERWCTTSQAGTGSELLMASGRPRSAGNERIGHSTSKVPPFWEPSLELRGYPFRVWLQYESAACGGRPGPGKNGRSATNRFDSEWLRATKTAHESPPASLGGDTRFPRALPASQPNLNKIYHTHTPPDHMPQAPRYNVERHRRTPNPQT